LSLVVAQPGDVDVLVKAAVDGGASVLKATKKSFWGYGGVMQAPDGAIWKVATSAKKDKGPATREVDDVVLLLGVADVKASKRFYAEQGLTVAKSFGSKYVEFEAAGAPVKLALYGRKALAKDAGVDPAGAGSHRIAISRQGPAFTDPDGFAWETSAFSAST
jgi:predicted lactoylglutathione lyase